MYKKVVCLLLAVVMLLTTWAPMVVAEGASDEQLSWGDETPIPNPDFWGETVWAEPEETFHPALDELTLFTTIPSISLHDMPYGTGVWQENPHPGARLIDNSLISAWHMNLTATSVTLGGTIGPTTGNLDIYQRGFWFRPATTNNFREIWVDTTHHMFQHTITDLTPNTEYLFRAVFRYRGYAHEVQSYYIRFTTPGLNTPSIPLFFNATPGVDRVQLNWQPPASDGGSPITGYQVSMNNWATYQNVAGTSLLVQWLDPGQHTFWVRAVNAAGVGSAAQVTATIATLSTPTVVGDRIAVTDTTATLMGQVLNIGGAPLTDRVCSTSARRFYDGNTKPAAGHHIYSARNST